MIEKGTFIRIGATSVPAKQDTIREMIMETTGTSFESCISINQNLTFFYTEKIFKDKELNFGDSEKKLLGIINDENKYTNLGLLLSDECPYTIKLAMYKDNTKTEFIDRKETRVSSILEQLVESYGSGIPRLLDYYKCSILIPEIQVATNTFLVTIPKLELKEEYKKTLDLLKIKGGSIRREELEEYLGTKKVTTISILNEMINRKLITKIGGSRDIKYRIK